MNLFAQNSKMRVSGSDSYLIYNFGIPAYKDREGLVTCPSAGICKDYCYGLKGHYSSEQTQDLYDLRNKTLDLTNFSEVASIHIENLRPRAFRQDKQLAIRLFDIGDVRNLRILKKLIRLCLMNPDVIFYHYTKRVLLFKKYFASNPRPKNFITIFSFGGKEDDYIEVSTDRHAMIFESLDDLKSMGYVDASHDDSVAFTSPSNRIGLIEH